MTTRVLSRMSPVREEPLRRPSLCLLVVLTLLASVCWGEENVRLFFHKTAAGKAPEGPKHVVREGEWLYKILEDAGFSREEFPQVIPKVRAMNPHVADFNHLRAGQVLYLPRAPKAGKASASHRPPVSPSAPPTLLRKEYVVQPGETLTQILRRETGATDAELYARLFDVVRQYNPHIHNLDALRAGDRLELPAGTPWRSDAEGNASSASAEDTSPNEDAPLGAGENATQEVGAAQGGTGGNGTGLAPAGGLAVPASGDAPQSTIERSGSEPAQPAVSVSPLRSWEQGRAQARQLLQGLGLTLIPGEEALFPLEDGSWFAVNLRETPALSTPWGARILLLDAPKPASWMESARAAGFVPIMVPADWQLRPVLQALAGAFPQQVHLWPQGRNLVLPRQGMSINLKAALVAVLEGGRTFALWTQDQNAPPLPQGVREILAAAQVTLLETDASGTPFAPPALPGAAMLLPAANAAWLHKQLDARFPEIRPLTSPGQILAFLRHGKHLVSKHITLSWVRGANELSIQIPAWLIDGEPPIALLEDPLPATVALLAQNGYQCARMER